MRVTLLASDLGATGGGTFAAGMATHLPPRFAVTLLALAAGPSTATAHLARAGVRFRVLPVRHAFDLRGLLDLRRAVADSKPELLHVVGRQAYRVRHLLPRPPHGRAFSHHTRTEAHLAGEPFGVGGPVLLPAPDGPAADLAAFGVPPGSRVVLAAGGFDRAADLRSAVWAFDVLKYTAPDWRLVLAGDGPLRGEVERFARQLGGDDFRVHFLGQRDDLPALVRSAHVVWVTHRDGGTATAAEALSAGVPVLGFRTFPLRRVTDGSAVLVPLGDPVALASATFNLRPDPALAGFGKDRAARFSADKVADGVAYAYDAYPAAPLPAAGA